MTDHKKLVAIKQLIDETGLLHERSVGDEIYNAVKKESMEDILYFIHDLINLIYDIEEVVINE